MSDVQDLYQEIILDHHRKPRNCYAIDCPNRHAHGHNPLCGDTVKVYLRINHSIIEEISFEGSGCAICTASCSIMTESVKGKTVDEAIELFEGFHELLTSGDPDAATDDLGKLRVFEGVREFPVRIKCATLAWHTLHAALDDKAAEHATDLPISTE
jgi:nitrogen fixation NifU-like protein